MTSEEVVEALRNDDVQTFMGLRLSFRELINFRIEVVIPPDSDVSMHETLALKTPTGQIMHYDLMQLAVIYQSADCISKLSSELDDY